jgi:hypothetical protein
MAHRQLSLVLLLVLCCSQHNAVTGSRSTAAATAVSQQAEKGAPGTPAAQDLHTNDAAIAAATNEYEGDMITQDAAIVTDAAGELPPNAYEGDAVTDTVVTTNSNSRPRSFFSWWESGSRKQQQQQKEQQRQQESAAVAECSSESGQGCGGSSNSYEGETVTEQATKPVSDTAAKVATTPVTAAVVTEAAQVSASVAEASNTYEGGTVTVDAAQPFLVTAERAVAATAAAQAVRPAAAGDVASGTIKEAATATAAATNEFEKEVVPAITAEEIPAKPQLKRKLAAAGADTQAAASKATTTESAELSADLAAMFKPVYSWDDPSTHAPEHKEPATRKSHNRKSLEAAATVAAPAGTAQTSGASGAAAGTAATARRFSGPVSIDNTSLGLAGMPVPGSSSPPQQQASGARQSNITVRSTGPPAGSNAPGSFTGGPSLTPQHSDWQSDNPQSNAGELQCLELLSCWVVNCDSIRWPASACSTALCVVLGQPHAMLQHIRPLWRAKEATSCKPSSTASNDLSCVIIHVGLLSRHSADVLLPHTSDCLTAVAAATITVAFVR